MTNENAEENKLATITPEVAILVNDRLQQEERNTPSEGGEKIRRRSCSLDNGRFNGKHFYHYRFSFVVMMKHSMQVNEITMIYY